MHADLGIVEDNMDQKSFNLLHSLFTSLSCVLYIWFILHVFVLGVNIHMYTVCTHACTQTNTQSYITWCSCWDSDTALRGKRRDWAFESTYTRTCKHANNHSHTHAHTRTKAMLEFIERALVRRAFLLCAYAHICIGIKKFWRGPNEEAWCEYGCLACRIVHEPISSWCDSRLWSANSRAAKTRHSAKRGSG